MHLPDGFLDVKTTALTAGLAGAGLGAALRQVKRGLSPRETPMLGLAAAFVFAAQMINFPVVAGTSGHLVGGVLAAVLLGPAAAVVVMACVMIVQCLMFNDGGLLALGANLFNMGLVNVWGGYFIFRLLRLSPAGRSERGAIFAAAVAAWFGAVLAALACAGEMAFSRTAPWSVAFPAMTNIHLLTGLGEGLITALILAGVVRARPEWLSGAGAAPGAGYGSLVAYGLLVSLGLALFVAPFACPWPDGLESVARALGFDQRAAPPLLASPLAEYRLPFIGSAVTATALAGVLGSLVAFTSAWFLACRLAPGPVRRNDDAKS